MAEDSEADSSSTTQASLLRDSPASREVASSRMAFRSGRVIDVRSDGVVLADGTVERDVVVHPGAVGIIAINDRREVLLVRQYRHPVRRMLWEPPAGLLDVAGESPLAAARRELYEEAHLEAANWRILVDMFTSPGMTDEAVRIYLARDVRTSPRGRHRGEAEEVDMTSRWVAIDEAVQAIAEGRIHNPLAVAGLMTAIAAQTWPCGWDGLREPDCDWPEMSDFVGSEA